jgi:arginase
MPSITLIGVPWDASSSGDRGAAGAPQRIRDALWSPASNTWNERGDDLAAPGVLDDVGDLQLPIDGSHARAAIEEAVRRVLRGGGRPLVLGGDHSITYPVLRAFRETPEPPVVLHFDAHADLYDEFPPRDSAADSVPPDRYSHACPFARVMEEQLARRLVQVGIRTLTGHQRQQARRFGVEMIGADRWRDALAVVSDMQHPVYVSLDIDVIEPGLAPGISHPEPGGLAVRDVLDILARLRVPVVGADLVEYNPHHDVRDLTAHVAAKFVKELVGLLAR